MGQVRGKMHLSNSLITHQVKTKQITTVKEAWLPGLNRSRSIYQYSWKYGSEAFGSTLQSFQVSFVPQLSKET